MSYSLHFRHHDKQLTRKGERNFLFGGGAIEQVSVPVEGLGTKFFAEAEAVCRHCLQSLIAETIKIQKFSHNLPPDS